MFSFFLVPYKYIVLMVTRLCNAMEENIHAIYFSYMKVPTHVSFPIIRGKLLFLVSEETKVRFFIREGI